MKILAVSSGIYPNNSASSIRHLAILRGINENNSHANLCSIYAEGKNVKKMDFYYGVRIDHLAIKKKKVGKKILKFFYSIMGVLKFAVKLIKLKNNNSSDKIIVLLYPTSNRILLPLVIICILFNVKVTHERTEYPFLMRKKSILNSIREWIYLNLTLKFFNKLIVISTELKNLFKPFFNREIIIIPILVEPDRFRINAKSKYKFPYIAYCGSLSIFKDGIDILIESFALIAEDYPDYKLVFIGNFEKVSDRSIIYKKIRFFNLNNRIIFLGEIPRDKVYIYLKNARALLLSRPDNIQSRFGLPTKLAEYLITGNPTIVTSVGDIPLYIKDGESAFIAKPGDVESFSDKIKLVIDDYKNAVKVGSRGREICKKKFHYKRQAKYLIDQITT